MGRATMRRMCARPARATCTTGTIAASRVDGQRGGGPSLRWVSSIASTHAAVPPVRFPSLEASWGARRRRRKSRKPALLRTPTLLGPLTSMLYILQSTEAADSPCNSSNGTFLVLPSLLMRFHCRCCCCFCCCSCRCRYRCWCFCCRRRCCLSCCCCYCCCCCRCCCCCCC